MDNLPVHTNQSYMCNVCTVHISMTQAAMILEVLSIGTHTDHVDSLHRATLLHGAGPKARPRFATQDAG